MTDIHHDLATRLRRIAGLARFAATPYTEREEPRIALTYDRLLDAADDADRAARVIGSGASRWHGRTARYAGTAIGVAVTGWLAYATSAPWWALCPAVVIVGLAGGKLGRALQRRIRGALGRRATAPIETVEAPDPLATALRELADLRAAVPERIGRIPLLPLDRGDSAQVGELLLHTETTLCQAMHALADEAWHTGVHQFPEAAHLHDEMGCAVAVHSGRTARRVRNTMWALLDRHGDAEPVAYAVGRLATARDLLLETALRLDHPPPTGTGLGTTGRNVLSVCCGLAAGVISWWVTRSTVVVASGFILVTAVIDGLASIIPELHGTPDCAELADELEGIANGPAETAATTAARRNARVAAGFVRAAVTDLAGRRVEDQAEPRLGFSDAAR